MAGRKGRRGACFTDLVAFVLSGWLESRSRGLWASRLVRDLQGSTCLPGDSAEELNGWKACVCMCVRACTRVCARAHVCVPVSVLREGET